MAITLSGDGISSDAIASLAASKLTGQVPDANAPSGSVIQVVNATTTNGGSYISTTSTSFVTTGLSVSITPTSSTNKIFICFTGVGQGANNNGRFTVFRNSTNLGSSSGFTQTNVAGRWVPLAINFLDSPSTTSSTSYAVYYLNSAGDITYFGGDGQTCSITLMEIAA